jgi:epoxyqueuosine reductase
VAVGITSADRFDSAEPLVLAWLRQERQGQMAWMTEERARRSCRPAELLPGARSLIVVAAPYAGQPEPAPLPPMGRLARYARGRDYHDVLRERLLALIQRLEARAGHQPRCRLFVDSSPLLEREAAARAGLGFVGKNTCLIVPGVGSFVLLGAILTDLALVVDRPPVRDCGRCSLCLDACPTGALVAPNQLDARRCISYLTIEQRGPLAAADRPLIGSHLLGCDICQEVCPWNQGHVPLPWPELAAGPSAGRDFDLLEALDLSEQEFRERFRVSAVSRTKRSGFVRNAVVALANHGDRRAVPALARRLAEDSDPVVRGHAAWALRQLGGPEADAALELASRTEADPLVRVEIGAPPGRAHQVDRSELPGQ